MVLVGATIPFELQPTVKAARQASVRRREQLRFMGLSGVKEKEKDLEP